MTDPNFVLLAVDPTEASTRAIDYVGDIAAKNGSIRILLAHILRPVPTEFLEFGGASDPKEEAREDQALEQAQAKWIEEAAASEAKPLFEKAKALLDARGVSADAIETRFADSIPEDKVADLLLGIARDAGCGTIAVGRQALPWLSEVFHRHVASDLIEGGDGIGVWVIG